MILSNNKFLKLTGLTSGTVALFASGTTTNYNLTLPAAQGAVNFVLLNNGSGRLSWLDESIKSFSVADLGGIKTGTWNVKWSRLSNRVRYVKVDTANFTAADTGPIILDFDTEANFGTFQTTLFPFIIWSSGTQINGSAELSNNAGVNRIVFYGPNLGNLSSGTTYNFTGFSCVINTV